MHTLRLYHTPGRIIKGFRLVFVVFSFFKSVAGRRTRSYLNSRSAESRVWPIIKCAIFRRTPISLAARFAESFSSQNCAFGKWKRAKSSFRVSSTKTSPLLKWISKFMPVSRKKHYSREINKRSSYRLDKNWVQCLLAGQYSSVFTMWKRLHFGVCVYTRNTWHFHTHTLDFVFSKY